jgi:hypothetical protein
MRAQKIKLRWLAAPLKMRCSGLFYRHHCTARCKSTAQWAAILPSRCDAMMHPDSEPRIKIRAYLLS